jgi:TBC1 domain family member 20
VERLQRDDDDDRGEGAGVGMTHSLLNALPEIVDDVPVVEVVKEEEDNESNINLEKDPETLIKEEESIPEDKKPPVKIEGSPSLTDDYPAERSCSRSSTPRLTLSFLLSHADTLHELYPPTHPGLALSSIMGPQSVVYTWREPSNMIGLGGNNGSELMEDRLTDDEAEAMVAHPGLVVYPYIEEDDDIEEDGSEEKENGWGWWSEKKRPELKQSGKEMTRQGKERKGPRKLRKNVSSKVERRMVLAGAVVVLGVAMAVYGTRLGTGRGSIVAGWDVHGREWRWVGRWVGGALVGVLDRMVALSGVKD